MYLVVSFVHFEKIVKLLAESVAGNTTIENTVRLVVCDCTFVAWLAWLVGREMGANSVV